MEGRGGEERDGKKKKKEKEGGKGEERGDDGSIQSGCGEMVEYGKEKQYGHGISLDYNTIDPQKMGRSWLSGM
jgi:hypothetical protein